MLEYIILLIVLVAAFILMFIAGYLFRKIQHESASKEVKEMTVFELFNKK